MGVDQAPLSSTHFPEYDKTETHSTKTTIPFVKNNEFDYAVIVGFLGDKAKDWAWLIFIPIVIFIITAVSNGANVTDGIDGLTAGTSAVIGVVLGILAYVSGNMVFADYLNIIYIPDTGELVIFIAAFIGACVGFLWYNAFPAQVFMGDTGSLALGELLQFSQLQFVKNYLFQLFVVCFLSRVFRLYFK